MSTPTPNVPRSSPLSAVGGRLRLLCWLALGAVCLALLFGVLGYFWLPGFAKSRLESALGAVLHRPVSIERLTVSPYALAATVEGFKAGDVLSVDRLYLDLSAASLLRGVPVVSALRVERPKLHLVRESGWRLNVSDLLDVWLAEKKEERPTPEFAIHDIAVEGGEIELVDKVAGRTQRLSDVELTVPFITSVASRREVFVEPRFSARVNGAALSIGGRLRPFGAARDGTLAVALTDLDLMPLLAYAPPSPALLRAARLGARLELDLQAPAGKAPALSVAGDVSLKDVRADLLGGRLRVRAAQLSADGVRADLARRRVELKALRLVPAQGTALALRQVGQGGQEGPEGRTADFLRLESLGLTDIAVDLGARRITVADGKLSAPDLTLRRTREGRLDLIALAAGGGAGGAEGKAAREPAAAETAAAPWSWSLAHFSVNGGNVTYGDDNLPKVKPFTLAGLAVDVGRLASGEAAPVPLKASASVSGKGRLALAGSVNLKGEADLALDARQVDLVALQGWAADRFNALLTRGELSFKGSAKYQGGRAAVDGELALGNVNVLDRVNAEDLLRWKRLRLTRLSLATAPLSLRVGEVALNDFSAKVLLNERGQLNLKGIARSDPELVDLSAAEPGDAEHVEHVEHVEHADGALVQGVPAQVAPMADAVAQAAPAAPVVPAVREPGPDVRIGRVTITDGRVRFTDRFIRPNYSVRLTDLNGSVEALAAGTLSPLELQGSIDGTAPLKIKGRIDPLSSPPNLEIQASARGIDMPGFSAYSGRYVGYAIEKGKLSMDVQYKVEHGQLTAENQLFLDQLTFGDKVESKDALSIPVNLAVALLKNSRGEIDIHLPISGSLNDPKFSIGGIVVKALLNLVVKAVTSPFALLGSLFGGGEDLSNAVFPPGLAVPTPEVETRLRALAKAMAERPALTLEVTGRADPEQDKAGIKRATLDRKLRARKLAEQVRKAEKGGRLNEVTLSAAEYPLYLEKVYADEKIPDKPRNVVGLAKSLPPAEMEARLLAFYPAGDAELRALAEQRGRRTQAWLLETGKVPAERVFLLAPKVEAAKGEAPGNRVDFSLR